MQLQEGPAAGDPPGHEKNPVSAPIPAFFPLPAMSFDGFGVSSRHSLGTTRIPTAAPRTLAAAASLFSSFSLKEQQQQLLSVVTHPVCTEEFRTTGTLTFRVTGTKGYKLWPPKASGGN